MNRVGRFLAKQLHVPLVHRQRVMRPWSGVCGPSTWVPLREATASPDAEVSRSEGFVRSSGPTAEDLRPEKSIGSRKTVLIIDDDADLRESLQEVLQDAGYLTALAKDGRSALTYLRGHATPGVLLLDWNMLPMTGAQLMTELGGDPVLSKIPVVLVTAELGTPPEARNKKLAAVLTKPVHLDQLLAVVGRYCRPSL